MSNHTLKVSTFNGQVVSVLKATTSLNTWTRKDGGLTVRVDNSRTIRFDKASQPKVIKRKHW